jgi:hypothetical protein
LLAEDLPQQLLCQLVATLLVHADAASTAELQQAMCDLCQLTQRRIDGLHLTKLIAGFADAQAAVAAAAAAAAEGVTSSNASARRSSTAATDAENAPKLPTEAEPPTAAAAVYMTPAVPKSRSRLGLMQASASARKPQSRLKALQKSSSKAAAAAEDDGISGLAGLMATKLQLAADDDEEDKDNAQDAAACGDANAATVVPQPAAAVKQVQPQRAGSAAAGGRRVRFAAEAEQDEGQQSAGGLGSSCAVDGDSYEHLVVPQSLARHTVRRSRLSEGQGCLKAAAAAGGTSSSSSSSRRSVIHTAAAAGSDSGVGSAAEARAGAASSKCGFGRSRSGAAASASRQQQQRAWVPPVLLLLDGHVQQLPWESCQGLRSQNMYRCAQ